MRARARAAGRTAILLDGREVDPSPDGFRQAVQRATGPATAGRTTVLLVDGYEQLGAIDGWLRQDLIPSLPAEDVVVLAGREPPGAGLAGRPGLAAGGRDPSAGPSRSADSADLLARAGVAEPDRERLVGLGRGHPLALALLADVARTAGCRPASPTCRI